MARLSPPLARTSDTIFPTVLETDTASTWSLSQAPPREREQEEKSEIVHVNALRASRRMGLYLCETGLMMVLKTNVIGTKKWLHVSSSVHVPPDAIWGSW